MSPPRRRRILLFVLVLLLFVVALGAILRPEPAAPADPAPPPMAPPSPAEVAAGRRLYLEPGANLGCATCHGRNAEGSRLGPALVGVVDIYELRYQGDAAKVRRRFVDHMTDPDAFPALGPGQGEFIAPMPPYAKLPREHREALAAYLMSLAKP